MVSTSRVARQTLSMRLGMLRFTRLTNGFRKRLKNHLHMLSLYFVHSLFVRMHKPFRMTPAMAAGVTNTLHDMAWIVAISTRLHPPQSHAAPTRKKIIQAETPPARHGNCQRTASSAMV